MGYRRVRSLNRYIVKSPKRAMGRGDTGIIESETNKGLKRRAMFPFCLEMDSLILSKKRGVV
jgi:hypothetical protein